MKTWTVQMTDQTAPSLQSDLDLHCSQKLLVSSSVRKDLIIEIEFFQANCGENLGI